MNNFVEVTQVEHYTDRLFRIRTAKPDGFKFRAGQFTMIGMGDDDIMRAYSIASAPEDNFLEFYSIKVSDGPLTSRLQHVKVGDAIEIGTRPTGTLVLDNLEPTGNLWLLSTGTGIAPFLSLIRHQQTYQLYDKIILTHTVREIADLTWSNFVKTCNVIYYPTVTREPFENSGRITDCIYAGTVFNALNLPKWSPKTDRVMLCGSIGFNNEMKGYLEENGWHEGNRNKPGTFVQERAFVS